MLIGDIFEFADCIHCGRKIQHEYWGNGGNSWTHDGEWYCARPSVARPEPGTIEKVPED